MISDLEPLLNYPFNTKDFEIYKFDHAVLLKILPQTIMYNIGLYYIISYF